MKKKHVALGIGGALGATIAWKLATRAATVNFEDYADKIDHAENSHFIEVDGMEIHYQEFGDPKDPKLILIHGYTASTYVWTTTAPKFAKEGFHVIAVDLIGFGFSEKPSWFDYRIASQARMISRLMDHLGIGKATLIGNSYGGAVAAWVTLDYPERVEKLVLVDAVINDEPTSNPVLKVLSVPGIGEVLSPFAIDSKLFLKKRMQDTLDKTSHHLITEKRLETVLRPLKAADAHNALLTTARNWDANRIEQDAHLIGQPTLVVWGDNDTVIPIKNGEKLYDQILNSRFVVFKDCGHVPQEEKPDMFTELVLEFCRDRKGHLEAKEGEEMELRQIEA
ncbi:MAG: alpha/beta hydrolase [Acidobacteria bacterium]|nr:alpha/beta hydrolase [Acidobacteriota bacterium]